MAQGWQGTGLLKAVEDGLATPPEDRPKARARFVAPPGLGPIVELLRVLLKMKCDSDGVAQKLVANASDLEQVAADDNADVPALRGWRRELFGDDALALKHGQIALAIDGNRVSTVPTPDRRTKSAAD